MKPAALCLLLALVAATGAQAANLNNLPGTWPQNLCHVFNAREVASDRDVTVYDAKKPRGFWVCIHEHAPADQDVEIVADGAKSVHVRGGEKRACGHVSGRRIHVTIAGADAALVEVCPDL